MSNQGLISGDVDKDAFAWRYIASKYKNVCLIQDFKKMFGLKSIDEGATVLSFINT